MQSLKWPRSLTHVVNVGMKSWLTSSHSDLLFFFLLSGKLKCPILRLSPPCSNFLWFQPLAFLDCVGPFTLIPSWSWANTHTHESLKKSDDKQLLHVREEAKVFKKQQPACREPYTPVKLDHKILHRLQTRLKPRGNNAAVFSCVGFLLKGLPLSSTRSMHSILWKWTGHPHLTESPSIHYCIQERKRKNKSTSSWSPCWTDWLKYNILLSTLRIASLMSHRRTAACQEIPSVMTSNSVPVLYPHI